MNIYKCTKTILQSKDNMTNSIADRIAIWERQLAHSLEYSAKWRAEGNFNMESQCTESSVHYFLLVALLKAQNSEEGVYHMTDPVCREQLLRFHELERKHWGELKAGAPVGTPWIGHREIFSAWLIGEFGVADDWIVEIRDPVYMKFNASKSKDGRFISEYERSLECLARKTPFEPHFDDKLEGILKYWVAYPLLISAITNMLDISSALEGVHKCFQVHLRDKRFSNPLEYGSPNFPVNWDFRLASIMRAKDHYYGKSPAA